eukprot:gb/GEZN01007054.1/.p1 GENE.gb/GEZN01007054.1/~~gb/GEZN01007054.1/.p1  ORF type:complete len:439 (+),score=85.72 gb/GEZN01007054.1/:178-1494(+)
MSFPLLKPKDIISCLKQLEIPVTMAELKEPSAKGMQKVYERFMDYLMGISKEELRQPQFSALHNLEFPELHEASLPELMVLKTLLRLLTVCGVHDVSLKKITEPTYQGTRKILSALINFAKFRETRLEAYQQFSEQTDQLLELKQTLEDEKTRWTAQLQHLQAQKEDRMPQVLAIKEETYALEEQIREQLKIEMGFKEGLEQVHKEAEEANGNLESVRASLEEIRLDNTKLKSQVVRSPEKLQRSIATMSENSETLKEEVGQMTHRLRDSQTRHASVLKISNKLQKRMAQIKAIEDQMNITRTLGHEVKNARTFLEEWDKRMKDLIAQEEHMKKAVTASQDKLFRLQRQFEQKKHKTQITMSQLNTERDVIIKDLAKEQEIIEEHHRLTDLRKREYEALQTDNSREMARLKSKYEAFQKQVEQYHSRMELAFTAPQPA